MPLIDQCLQVTILYLPAKPTSRIRGSLTAHHNYDRRVLCLPVRRAARPSQAWQHPWSRRGIKAPPQKLGSYRVGLFVLIQSVRVDR